MIYNTLINLFSLLIFTSLFFNSCTPEETITKAVVETSEVTFITEATATCGGIITSDGGAIVEGRGVCWSISPNPTIEDNITSDAAGTGAFTITITGLAPGTTYYARAYATNKAGTGYGLQVTFTTQSGVIGLTTDAATVITAYTARSGGTISSDGGAAVTARGVCWNTSSEPTITNSKTANGSGIGSYTSSITGLTPLTTYYVRSYAINSVGTSYGNEVSFTTKGTVTDVEGNVYNFITIGTQAWMIENLKTTKYNDGTSIPYVTVSSAWGALSTPGYCFYNNDAANKNTYGALYNWYTVNSSKLAPTGWHVPTDAEWTTLENYLIANGFNYDGTTTGNKIAKSFAATTDWYSYSGTGTVGNDLTKNNTSGFAGLPGGNRDPSGAFGTIGGGGDWWSSTENSAGFARNRYLSCASSGVYSANSNKQFGYSVRCVKD